MLASYVQATDATAAAYETTEEARLLLPEESELLEARRAVGEAAYYLSDTLEPDERAVLLSEAEGHCAPHRHEAGEDATAALGLLREAVVEVEQVSRGPSASSEVRIALRALREAVGDLAGHVGLDTNPLELSVSRNHSLRTRGRWRPSG